MSIQGKLILIGKVAGTHGIRGHLKITPYSGDTESIISKSQLILVGPDGENEIFKVAESSAHGKKVLVRFSNFNNINQILHLVGREIYVSREQLPDLPEGEFYWYDLIGMQVNTTEGASLGVIDDVIVTGSNDVYVVKSVEGEHLIPALEDIVLNVDLHSRVMLVKLPDEFSDL
jgi:16S rRNA processing protein RimM